MTSRKAVLLDGLIAHLVKRGVADVSLRPMTATGGAPRRPSTNSSPW